MPGEPLSHAQGELILILQENPALCMPVNPEEKIDKYIIKTIISVYLQKCLKFKKKISVNNFW